MNEPLQQITNRLLTDKSIPSCQHHKTSPSINDILQMTQTQIDYEDCLPNSVHQRKIGLLIKQTHQFHIIISFKIEIEDQKLTDTPDYIFGVRKQSASQYYDDYRFKATLKGVYNFMVGVKTPQCLQRNICGALVVRVQDYQGCITVNLKQFVTIPKIICLKQLVNGQNLRIIKLGIMASKSKRQIKITFKYDKQLAFNLQTDLISLEEDNKSLQVRPKIIQPTGKGFFLLSLIATFPIQTTQIIVERRILTLKLKDVNVYYHFPVEVAFYPDNKKNKWMVE